MEGEGKDGGGKDSGRREWEGECKPWSVPVNGEIHPRISLDRHCILSTILDLPTHWRTRKTLISTHPLHSQC